MHQRVFRGLSPHEPRACIPACLQFVHNKNQTWWEKHGPRFPKDFQIRCKILITDPIPPFPQVVRDALVDLYCPEPLRPKIRSSKPDQDCLIRPYLGRRRRLEKRSRFQAFSLRNFPLYIDQMEKLGLNIILYAKIMAETLANIYWRAHVDANDLEFVLAPAHSQSAELSMNSTIINSYALVGHVVWIIDFDCCKQISMDIDGVEQAARAFLENDPFCPRPGCKNAKDKELWKVFSDHFIATSLAIPGPGNPESCLPEL